MQHVSDPGQSPIEIPGRAKLCSVLGFSVVLMLAGCSFDYDRFRFGTPAPDAGAGDSGSEVGRSDAGPDPDGGGVPGSDADTPEAGGRDGAMPGDGGGDAGADAQVDARVPECDDTRPCADPRRLCEMGRCVYECDDARPCQGAGEMCVANQCFVPPPREPTGFAPSSGGGIGTSASYRLKINFGVPQPMGHASSPNYRAEVGLLGQR